jgi:hypothetical protein
MKNATYYIERKARNTIRAKERYFVRVTYNAIGGKRVSKTAPQAYRSASGNFASLSKSFVTADLIELIDRTTGKALLTSRPNQEQK